MTLKDLEGRLRVLEDIEAIKELKSQFDEYQDDGQNPEAWSDLSPRTANGPPERHRFEDQRRFETTSLRAANGARQHIRLPNITL